MECIQTVEFYLAIKRNELLICATKGMKLEDIYMLGKRSQSQESTYCMNALLEMFRIGKCVGTESERSGRSGLVARRVRKGGAGVLGDARVCRVSFLA